MRLSRPRNFQWICWDIIWPKMRKVKMLILPWQHSYCIGSKSVKGQSKKYRNCLGASKHGRWGRCEAFPVISAPAVSLIALPGYTLTTCTRPSLCATLCCIECSTVALGQCYAWPILTLSNIFEFFAVTLPPDHCAGAVWRLKIHHLRLNGSVNQRLQVTYDMS